MQSATATKKRFTSLPFDTLLEIVKLLPPNNIVTIGRVNKSMHHVSTSRTVWLFVVRLIQDEWSIPPSTFPRNEMTVRELQHVATAHHRLIWRLTRTHRPSIEPPNGMRLLPLRIYPQTCVDISLLPGGRFLLVWTSGSDLMLYDLGPTFDYLSSRAMAEVNLFGFDFSRTSIQQDSTTGAIRMILTHNIEGDQEVVGVAIADINPDDVKPSFTWRRVDFAHTTGNLSVPPRLFGDMLLLVLQCGVIVYDINANKWCRIDTLSRHIYDVSYCRDLFIFCGTTDTTVDIVPIPTLQPHSCCPPPDTHATELATFELDDITSIRCAFPRWPGFKGVITETGGGTGDERIYLHSYANDYTIRVCQWDISYETDIVGSVVGMGHMKTAHVNGRGTFIFWNERGMKMGSFSQRPSTGDRGVIFPGTVLWDFFTGEQELSDICPFSGRLCVTYGRKGCTDILVVDLCL